MCFVFWIPQSGLKKNVSLFACVPAVTKGYNVLLSVPQIPAQIFSSLHLGDSSQHQGAEMYWTDTSGC